MNEQEGDAFAAAGGFGQGGAQGLEHDFTEEEREQMAQVQEAQEELRKKLYDRGTEE
jgi:hypothetical protein